MKPRLYFVLLFFLACCSCEKDNVNPLISNVSRIRGYKNWYIGSFRCGVYVPENYNSAKSYPLIVYLHGYTDTTTWNLEWYKEPVISSDPCIVLTPKCPKEEPFGWGSTYMPGTSPMMQKTYEMLAIVEQAFNLDRDRYYIYGTSMGGYGTYAAIRDNPGMFAAGYVLCGSSGTGIVPVLSSMPFWIFHGSEDNVVPVGAARQLYQAVLDYGGKTIRYTEYEGVGHNVWDYTRYETTLQTWLLAQRKSFVHDAPDAVNDFEVDPATGKACLHWKVPAPNPFPAGKNIWFCRIYRNGINFKEVYNNEHEFTDSTVVANTSCTYQVSAVNYYFMESRLSDPLSVTFNKK